MLENNCHFLFYSQLKVQIKNTKLGKFTLENSIANSPLRIDSPS